MDDELNASFSKPEPTFQGAPLEIREKIYQYWLRSACGGDAGTKSDRRGPGSKWLIWPYSVAGYRLDNKSPQALFLASRQVNEEANRVFWPLCRFGFDHTDYALAFVNAVPAARLAQIQHIHLRLMLEVPRLVDASIDELTMLWHLVPDLEQIRSKLPRLRSVTFDLDGCSLFGNDVELPIGIQNFQFQMAPFWHVKTIYVTCRHLRYRYSGSFLVERTTNGDYHDEGDARAGRVSSWITDTETAIRNAYCHFTQETAPNESTRYTAKPFEERFSKSIIPLFYYQDEMDATLDTGVEVIEGEV